MKAMNKILIILLNWNGKKDTLECLTSLSHVTYPHFTTIVVDNGSTDDSVLSIRKQFPAVPIFETGQNLGFAAGNNVGISWGLQKGYEWILLLNNDTTVAPDFLNAFMQAAKEKPTAKILGAKIYRYDKPTVIDHLGGMWDPKTAEFISLSMGQVDDGKCNTPMTRVDYVCGAALLMHHSIPRAIGLLEPRYFLFWEETDFCTKAGQMGFEVWTAPLAKVWHKVSSSFTGGKPHMQYFWWRSRLLYLKRNLSSQERRTLYRTVILPELWKTVRHYSLRSLQNGLARLMLQTPTEKNVQKALREKAGLLGVFDYLRGRFGNCPAALCLKKKT
jgi:GT2 family glycosyltransferase